MILLRLNSVSTYRNLDRLFTQRGNIEAMDRIHRLGQHRPVQAIKLVIEDSIESRIVQVCNVDEIVGHQTLMSLIVAVAREEIRYD